VIDDIVLNKVAAIERCLGRIREECSGDLERLGNQTVEDAVVLNLQRACEAAIDLAMHVVSRRRLGVPQSSRAAFELLDSAGVLSADLAERMKRMVGFRNVAVHDYVKIDRTILESIVTDHLVDFEELCRAVITAEDAGP